MFNPQLNNKGNLNHLLSIEGLSKDKIIQILDTAESFLKIGERDVKKVPILRGKTVCNVFFENSTRTRTTFEIAAKRLSADVINFSAKGSSVSKGESLKDTAMTLQAMGADESSIEYVEDRKGHDRRYSVNIDKITKLGWKKERTLDEALAETVQWYRDNRWWWEPLKGKK